MQTVDIRTSFLFVGDFNGHHTEWLGSTTTNRHGVLLTSRLSGCDQLVVGPTLDLLMTDVAPIGNNMTDVVAPIGNNMSDVVAPIGNLDHFSLSTVISMAQAIPNLCDSRKVLLKH